MKQEGQAKQELVITMKTRSIAKRELEEEKEKKKVVVVQEEQKNNNHVVAVQQDNNHELVSKLCHIVVAMYDRLVAMEELEKKRQLKKERKR